MNRQSKKNYLMPQNRWSFQLHADKTFIVRDFRVTWEHRMNFLVSPYYPESGGTVIDWMDENSWMDDEYDENELEYGLGGSDASNDEDGFSRLN